MVLNMASKWPLKTRLNSMPCLFTFPSLFTFPIPRIVPKGPIRGQPQKCLTGVQSSSLMSTVHIFFTHSSTSKQQKSVNFAPSTVLNSPQTSDWLLSNSDTLYLGTISPYLSVCILFFGWEGILFSTLIPWSLNSNCQQLGTQFSVFTVLSLLQWTK